MYEFKIIYKFWGTQNQAYIKNPTRIGHIKSVNDQIRKI